MLFRVAIFAVLAGSNGFGQLSTDQKLADFRHLAGLYAKQYAPYEWKFAVERFDLLDVGPWLDRVRATRDDLDFYDLMIEYVARLNDAHDAYTLPSTFSATLGFGVDVYEGRVLINSINRAWLPSADYPFQIGDGLVAVDGRDVESLIAEFARYAVAGNPASTRRNAADRITTRPQSRMPRAVELGERAEVVIRRADGALERYFIPWIRTGVGMTTVGPVPTAEGRRRAALEADDLAPLRELQNCELPQETAVRGLGARAPVFVLPAGFSQRLGRAPADVFLSGVYQAQGYRIGFIRISGYSPADSAVALNQFRREIAYFRDNTDGLIVDDMRNSGGGIGYVNALLQYLMPYRYRVVGFEIRATSSWVMRISTALESARARGAEPGLIRLYEAILGDLMTANRENRGRTGPLPLDDAALDREPARDAAGAPLAYGGPLMVLVDEFSASGSEAFAAVIQDNRRGILVGRRTMGAGGSVATAAVGSYSEGSTGVTQALMNRGNAVVTAEYPTAPYIENIGVRPDIEIDIMTRDSLLNGGRPFVEAFTAAMVEHLRRTGGAFIP